MFSREYKIYRYITDRDLISDKYKCRFLRSVDEGEGVSDTNFRMNMLVVVVQPLGLLGIWDTGMIAHIAW